MPIIDIRAHGGVYGGKKSDFFSEYAFKCAISVGPSNYTQAAVHCDGTYVYTFYTLGNPLSLYGQKNEKNGALVTSNSYGNIGSTNGSMLGITSYNGVLCVVTNNKIYFINASNLQLITTLTFPYSALTHIYTAVRRIGNLFVLIGEDSTFNNGFSVVIDLQAKSIQSSQLVGYNADLRTIRAGTGVITDNYFYLVRNDGASTKLHKFNYSTLAKISTKVIASGNHGEFTVSVNEPKDTALIHYKNGYVRRLATYKISTDTITSDRVFFALNDGTTDSATYLSPSAGAGWLLAEIVNGSNTSALVLFQPGTDRLLFIDTQSNPGGINNLLGYLKIDGSTIVGFKAYNTIVYELKKG